MKKCVNCEHLNDDDKIRCDKCGCLITVKEEKADKKYSIVCPKCDHIVSKKLENCPFCGEHFTKGNFLGLTQAEAIFLRLAFGRGK